MSIRGCFSILVALFLPAMLDSARAQGTAFTYQGRLRGGGAGNGGNFDLRFVLYGTSNTAAVIAGPVTNSASILSDGVLAVTLDFGSSLLNTGRVWLEIAVRTNGGGAFTVLSPRQEITSAPFAIQAANVAAGGISPGLYGNAVTFANPANHFVGTFSGDGSALSNTTGSSIQAGTITSNQLAVGAVNASVLDSNTWFLATNSPAVPAAVTNFLRGFLTPFDRGAKGDGVTDDTAALQAWLYDAGKSNLTAFLPPAPGGYYKITAPLLITNALHIQGSGGETFGTGGTLTKCRIHQMTAGQHGLVYANTGGDLVNPEYGGQADNLIIDGGLLITAQVYDPGSYGFAFYGSGGDADCNIISGLGCQNFGVGFLVASASNTKFTACSTFRDGDGVRIPGQLPGIGGGSAIVNNISFESCQLSYCYSNGLHLLSGVVTVQNGDVAVGNLLDGDWNARSVLLEGGNVVFHGVRFEYYGTNSNVAAIGPPNTMSMELDHCFFAATYTTSDTFGVFLSNCPCVFIDTQPSRASDFTQVREFNYGGYGSACVNLGTGPLNLLYHNFANGADVATYVGPFRSDYSGYRTPALNNFYFQDHSSVWNGSGQSYGGDDYTTSLFVGAHLRGFNGSATPYWADLLQYEKERQSFAFLNAGRVTNTWSARDLVASNSISVGWSGQFNGSGAGLTNLPPAAPSAALAGVTTLVQTISNPPTQAQVQAIQNKLNELINALKQP